MEKWHLYSKFERGISVGGSIEYVWLFGLIGGFVLLLASINFMNLSTAQSAKRAKEVGIRKTMGSLRGQLVGQFFTESLLVVLLAFGLALIVSLLCLPWVNEIAGRQMTIPIANPWFWMVCVSFIGLTGLVAGSYPAFYLSSFQPVKVLKGSFRVGRLAALPRKVLVVVQFTISVTLIIGTLGVHQQVAYAKNRPVGYNRNGLVMVQMVTPGIHAHFDAIREQGCTV